MTPVYYYYGQYVADVILLCKLTKAFMYVLSFCVIEAIHRRNHKPLCLPKFFFFKSVIFTGYGENTIKVIDA